MTDNIIDLAAKRAARARRRDLQESMGRVLRKLYCACDWVIAHPAPQPEDLIDLATSPDLADARDGFDLARRFGVEFTADV